MSYHDPDPVIRTTDLVKDFGDQRALDHISLSVPPGVILGVIGPSGCGKTTLVRTLTGITARTSGDVTVFGRDPVTLSSRQRSRFGYMPQLPVLFPNLTVWGNLTFMSSLYGLPVRRRRRRLAELLDLVDLTDHRSKQLADCSGGMQRRLSLAATLVHDPELLYLDEPTAGVDPILRERFWEHFRSLRDQGRTIVVPTQYVGEAVSCDVVAVMAEGRLITVQPSDQLSRVAFGGDPIALDFENGWVPNGVKQRLREQPFVRSARSTETGLAVVVADGQRDVEALRRHLEAEGTAFAAIEPAQPTFDEIFVRIIENDAASRQTPTVEPTGVAA
ncbi:MAG: ABC transporter ATP-binding protein [Actinomycetota bacterium]|nr:ABC transporter ATP-binding protein [Actinomycetota bacterium]